MSYGDELSSAQQKVKNWESVVPSTGDNATKLTDANQRLSVAAVGACANAWSAAVPLAQRALSSASYVVRVLESKMSFLLGEGSPSEQAAASASLAAASEAAANAALLANEAIARASKLYPPAVDAVGASL